MTTSDIISTVALVTGVPAPAITGRRRTDLVCFARFMTIAAIQKSFPWMSLQKTAREINRKYHGTIVNAMCRHRDLMDTSNEYRKQFSEVQKFLNYQPK